MSVSLRRSAVHAAPVPLLPPRGQNVMSRAFQILLCLVGLLLLSPVMLLVALGVKLGSRGPVFYRGQRVGKDERVFDIFKPGQIRWLERHLPGAWGVVFDDVAAGLLAGLILLLVRKTW